MREKEKAMTTTAPAQENVSSSGEESKNFGAESPPVLKGNGKTKKTKRVSQSLLYLVTRLISALSFKALPVMCIL